MQLTLFQWDLIAVGKGCASLARLDFNDARSRFAGVLNDLPGHVEALRGMGDLQFWEDVFREMEEMTPEFVPGFLWEKIIGFPFENSENHQTLRLNLLRRLLALLDDRPTFYAPPDLCSGYLHLLLAEYTAAEACLREVLRTLPENGRLQGYLADALYMQGRAEIAAAVYATALLLAPHDVAVESMRNRPLVAVIEEYGPALAPVHGFLQGLLPLVEQGKEPVSREALACELLRRAEQARRLGHHRAMVAARRDLKKLAPEILHDYLEWLGG